MNELTTEQQTIRTLGAFLKAIDDGGEAYDLFEDFCSDEVRDIVYDLAPEDCCEPFREAMATLGYEV